jgi:hypothetical protein
VLAYDPSSNPLNNNEWSFPLAECFHIAAFAFSVGTIAIVDFRLLGLAMTRTKTSQLLKDTMIWTLIGLVVVITSGLIIFSSDALRYYYNDAFRFKIIMLTVAIVYNYTIHSKVARADTTGPAAAVTALVSLAMWVSIVFAGLFYAFT